MEFFVGREAMAAGVEAANKAPLAADGTVGYTQVRAAWDAVMATMTGAERKALGLELLAGANGWREKEDDLSQAVLICHPCNTRGANRWSLYERALELVSNRHDKYSLVNLVNYLLTKIDGLEAAR